MIFIGPKLLTGIGQHAQKYTKLFLPNSDYYELGSTLPESEHGLVFTIPMKEHIGIYHICKKASKKPGLYDCV